MVVHGIIGCGRVAPNHVHGFKRLEQVRVKWLCDLDIVKAMELGRTLPGVEVTTDYSVVLSDPEVTSVSVAVDHGHHYAIAYDILKAKKHLLLEKPIALRIEDAQRLAGLAAENNLKFTVVSQHRFDPLVKHIKGLIRRGVLGSIVAVNASLECARPAGYYKDSYWRGSWDLEGGSVLINQAYHLLDAIRWLVGGTSGVQCYLKRSRLKEIIETEDTAVAILQFDGGALGTVNVTGAGSVEWRSRIELEGIDGFIAFDLDHPNNLFETQLPKVETLVLKGLQGSARLQQEKEATPGFRYYGTSHYFQIDDFVQAIECNRDCFIPPSEAIGTLGLILELYEKAIRIDM